MRNLATILALVTVASPGLADIEHDVRCREIAFSRSVETGDLERFASFIDPDARFVGGGVLRGREPIKESWAVFFSGNLPSIKWRPEFIEVLETGNLALSRGPYRVIDKNEQGESTESWGTFNSVWRLGDDGEWLIVFDAGNSSGKPPGDKQRELLDAEDDCETE